MDLVGGVQERLGRANISMILDCDSAYHSHMGKDAADRLDASSHPNCTKAVETATPQVDCLRRLLRSSAVFW